MWLVVLSLLLISIAHAEHFFSGPSALSWDSDEITRVRALHKRTFDDPERYADAENLADYLGLSPVEGVHLPIPVNVLLIGFNRDGKGQVEIQPEELQQWFETLDHIVPHTRVPLSELTCKEDGTCTDFEQVRKPRPLHSYVHYNVSVHAVEVTSELSLQFARTVKALSRPGEFGEGFPGRQVDVTGLEGVIDGMLAQMGILWSYNVLLVNPDVKSGYVHRAGFSKKEIDDLTSDAKKLAALKRAAQRYKNAIPLVPGNDLLPKSWHPSRSKEKFDVNHLMQESAMWSHQIKDWLGQRETLTQRVPNELKELQQFVLMKGIHADTQLSELLDILERNEQHRKEIKGTGGLRVLEPEEGCPLDMWAGHRRWIMMDLAAMQQDWGPFVGGDGIKTMATMPSVTEYFSKKPSADPDVSSNQLKEILVRQRQQHLDELHDYRVKGFIPKNVLHEAEMDLLHRFQAEHCLHMDQTPPLCQRIAQALSRLANKEHVFLSDKGEDVFMEWFAQDEQVDEAELDQEGRMKDLFLAHASALVSRAVRHVFIPPTLTWRGHSSDGMDISTPFSKKVTFRIYLMTDTPRDPKTPRRAFETESLRQELMGLKLDGQDFYFVVQHQNILDDPVLSTALAASLRSSTLERLETDSFLSEERLYFDSAELQGLLEKRLFKDTGPQQKTTTASHTHLEVPVFILTLDRDRAVFIDRHYIARAMENMVIVVQNSQYRGQHPLGLSCGDGIAGQTLAAPLKAALAAVMQHMGLLPSHLGYSPEHRAIAHDWTWSIGANPFSLTSPGWKISQAQKDALHRTYLLDTVDLSIEKVNHAIDLLQSIRPSDRSFEFLQEESDQLRALLKDFSLLVELWRRVMFNAGNLEFEKATPRLSAIEEAAQRFLDTAASLESGMEPLACQHPSSFYLGLLWLTDEVLGICLLIAVSIALYKLLPKRRKGKQL